MAIGASTLIVLKGSLLAGSYELRNAVVADGTHQAVSGRYAADLCVSTGLTSSGDLSRDAGGYIGQLTDPVSIQISAAQTQPEEASTNALSAAAEMDDETITRLETSEVGWEPVSGPISAVGADGVAHLGPVFQDELAVVTGEWASIVGEVSFVVRDSSPDNYGPVGGDGLDDAWQFEHFDLDSDGSLTPEEVELAGAGADPDGDGQANRMEWLAGYDPGDSLSYFDAVLLSVGADKVEVQVSSLRPGTRYQLIGKESLAGGAASQVLSTLMPEEPQTGVIIEASWGKPERGFFEMLLSRDE